MKAPLVVVVTGPPAAGKTTIARELAARLRLPLIAKDTIKEALFDALGTGDLAWSQRLGDATYLAMLAVAEESVAAGADLVLEANFIRGGESRLAALPARFVQVHCSAPLELLVERYASRSDIPATSTASAATPCATPSSQDGTIRSTCRAKRFDWTRARRLISPRSPSASAAQADRWQPPIRKVDAATETRLAHCGETKPQSCCRTQEPPVHCRRTR